MSSTTSSPTISTTTNVVVEKLITKEDPFHIHKTLGILCLLSFAIRIAMIGSSDMGFLSHPQYTIPTIVLHLLLNLSSLEFKIPQTRIHSNRGGFRIWPEYRLHSLVFACRSLCSIALYWYEQTQQQQQSYNYDWNILIVLATMAAADLSSISQGKYHSSTIRNMGIDPWAKYLFSAKQLLATTFVLFGIRRYSTHFIMLLIIQGNAFLMTLQRKNLAGPYLLLFIYGSALVIGGAVSITDNVIYGGTEYSFAAMACIGHSAILLRLGPRIIPGLSLLQNNKYLLWITMALILRQYRESFFLSNDPVKGRIIQGYATISVIFVFALGYYKAQEHNKNEKQIQSSDNNNNNNKCK